MWVFTFSFYISDFFLQQEDEEFKGFDGSKGYLPSSAMAKMGGGMMLPALNRPRIDKKLNGPVGGKWTQDEDNQLRDIVHEHGPKSWKKVASLLGSNRTDVQCLHRWNKVLKVRNCHLHCLVLPMLLSLCRVLIAWITQRNLDKRRRFDCYGNGYEAWSWKGQMVIDCSEVTRKNRKTMS
jgi:hypothetical protein